MFYSANTSQPTICVTLIGKRQNSSLKILAKATIVHKNANIINLGFALKLTVTSRGVQFNKNEIQKTVIIIIIR